MKRDRPLTRETGSVEEAIAMPMWSGFADPVALNPLLKLIAQTQRSNQSEADCAPRVIWLLTARSLFVLQPQPGN